MKALLPIALCICALGCASAPKAHEFTKSFPYANSYNEVWTAVIQTFAELNLPISNMEKDSGLIVTEWIDMKGEDTEHGGACDCGNEGLATKMETQGKFNVFVKRAASDSTKASLTVNALYRQHREFMDNQTWVNCVSTGILETKFNSQVAQSLSKTP